MLFIEWNVDEALQAALEENEMIKFFREGATYEFLRILKHLYDKGMSLDEMIDLTGRTEEEIFESLKDLAVVLQSRRTAVNSVVDSLFSQEKAVDAYVAEVYKENSIKGFIDGLVAGGVSGFEEAVAMVMKRFSFTEVEAQVVVRKHGVFPA